MCKQNKQNEQDKQNKQELYIEYLKLQIEGLRSLIKPFAYIAKSIPSNWPDDCRLRIDEWHDGSKGCTEEYLAYHPVEFDGGKLPFISDWRALNDC